MLKELASVTLPSSEHYTTMNFSRDGETVLLGTNGFASGRHVLGVRWVDWQTQATRAMELPQQWLKPDIDSSAYAIDFDGNQALALAGSYSAYRPGEEELWRVSRSGDAPVNLNRAKQVHFAVAPDARHVAVLNGEHIDVVPFTGTRVLAPGATGIAVSNDARYVAFTRDRHVYLHDLGTEVTRWQIHENLLRLLYDGDVLCGVTRDAWVVFKWNERPRVIRVPQATPWALSGSTAIFSGKGLFEHDLATGQTLAYGPLPSGDLRCCDARLRRIATLDFETEMPRVRVFSF